MTEIYLIRHTQAEGNVYHAMQGHWDGDVTALGLRQLDALAERFRGVKLDALYSSDLHRAMLTADALRRFRPMELRTLFDLREINVGPWEARFFADIQHEQPREAELFLHRAEDFYLPGAERYGDVRRRAAVALEKIARENDGGVVAVVSHGVTIRCLLSHILGKPLDDPTLPICGNTGVTHLFFEDGRYTVDCAPSPFPPPRRPPSTPPATPRPGRAPTARSRASRPRPISPRPRAITAPTRAACCAFSRAAKAPVCSISTRSAALTPAAAGSACCISKKNTATAVWACSSSAAR